MPKNSPPIVIITGASGFVGTELIKHFNQRGWQVRALVRNARSYAPRDQVTYHEYDLNAPLDETAFRGADYLVHTAYMKYDRRHSDAFQVNLRAAKRLIKAADKHGLKKSVFMSSMSAHGGAESVYGKQKLAIEKVFTGPRAVSLRSGLIMGDGGIVKQMAGFMRSKHMVPLIGGGKQPLQVIGVYDLARVIEAALTTRVSGVLTVATPEVYSYKDFYRALAKRLGIKVLFVPVPFWALMTVLKTVAFLPLPLSVSTDNALGLKHLRSADTAPDLKRLNIELDNLEQILVRPGVVV